MVKCSRPSSADELLTSLPSPSICCSACSVDDSSILDAQYAPESTVSWSSIWSPVWSAVSVSVESCRRCSSELVSAFPFYNAEIQDIIIIIITTHHHHHHQGLVGAYALGPAYSWVYTVNTYTLGTGAPLLACLPTPAHILGPSGPLPHAKNEVDRTTRSGDMAKPSADRLTDTVARDRQTRLTTNQPTNQPASRFAVLVGTYNNYLRRRLASEGIVTFCVTLSRCVYPPHYSRQRR